jgi:hypothetical protein
MGSNHQCLSQAKISQPKHNHRMDFTVNPKIIYMLLCSCAFVGEMLPSFPAIINWPVTLKSLRALLEKVRFKQKS